MAAIEQRGIPQELRAVANRVARGLTELLRTHSDEGYHGNPIMPTYPSPETVSTPAPADPAEEYHQTTREDMLTPQVPQEEIPQEARERTSFDTIEPSFRLATLPQDNTNLGAVLPDAGSSLAYLRSQTLAPLAVSSLPEVLGEDETERADGTNLFIQLEEASEAAVDILRRALRLDHVKQNMLKSLQILRPGEFGSATGDEIGLVNVALIRAMRDYEIDPSHLVAGDVLLAFVEDTLGQRPTVEDVDKNQVDDWYGKVAAAASTLFNMYDEQHTLFADAVRSVMDSGKKQSLWEQELIDLESRVREALGNEGKNLDMVAMLTLLDNDWQVHDDSERILFVAQKALFPEKDIATEDTQPLPAVTVPEASVSLTAPETIVPSLPLSFTVGSYHVEIDPLTTGNTPVTETQIAAVHKALGNGNKLDGMDGVVRITVGKDFTGIV